MNRLTCSVEIFCIFIALSIVVSGCTIDPITFQTVDANTNLPLADVQIEQQSGSKVMFFPHNSDSYYSRTNTSGMMTTQRLDVERDGNRITFRRNGYLESVAFVSHLGDDTYGEVEAPFVEIIGETEIKIIYKGSIHKNDLYGIIKVPMYRMGSSATKQILPGK